MNTLDLDQKAVAAVLGGDLQLEMEGFRRVDIRRGVLEFVFPPLWFLLKEMKARRGTWGELAFKVVQLQRGRQPCVFREKSVDGVEMADNIISVTDNERGRVNSSKSSIILEGLKTEIFLAEEEI